MAKKKYKKIEKRSSKARELAFKKRDSSKKVSKRASGALGVLKAMGATSGTSSGGRGRPSGSYKYGMPIQDYKKLMSQKKALYEQYQGSRQRQLKSTGLSPEQIKDLQYRKAIAQVGQRNDLSPYEKQKMMTGMSQKQMQVQNVKNSTDDELDFRRYAAKNTLSPSAQRILTAVRRIQNKGKSDDVRQQRILEERKIVGRSMNLMEAHKNMNKIKLDVTGVDSETNILMAPNAFKENPEDNILHSKRGNILDTKSYGHRLEF